jgi:hypothetical protein
MSNKILTIDQITLKAQEILENNLTVTRNIDKQYDSSFAKSGAKIGDTLRVRLPDRCLVHDGPTLQTDDVNQQSTTISITSQKHVGINFTTAEMTLSLDAFSDLVLKPRISQLAAAVDQDVCSVFKKIYTSVGTPGTTPSTSGVMLAANQKLNELAVEQSQRYLTVNAAANSGLVEGMKGFFNPTGTISKQFKSGLMAEGILGFDEINMSQSIGVHTCGTRSTTDTIVVNGTVSTQGQSTISINGGTGTATVEAGDVFTIAGVYTVNPQTRESTGSLQQFVVLEKTTATGGAWANIKISPPMYTASQALATIDAFPQHGAAVVFMGAAGGKYPQSLVYHKNAIAMASADLVMPSGVDMASRKVYNGISMRIVRQYDINNDRMPCRVDVLYGFNLMSGPRACRMWG